MTADGAAPDPERKMGAFAIDAVTALHAHLEQGCADADASPTSEELWRQVGATPMIRMSEAITEVFTLPDAAQLAAFAASKVMGLLSMRSVDRDHTSPETTIVQLTARARAPRFQAAYWSLAVRSTRSRKRGLSAAGVTRSTGRSNSSSNSTRRSSSSKRPMRASGRKSTNKSMSLSGLSSAANADPKRLRRRTPNRTQTAASA